MAAIVINVAGQYDDKAIAQAQKRLGDLKGSAAAAGGGIAGAFTNAGTKLSAVGASMAAFGGKMTKSVTLPIVGIGVASAVAFSKVDDALDSVAVATGATGETLAGLQDSFRTVAANSASSVDDVAIAIGELNTRLGLTGEPLESVSAAMLDLARVTGTDVATATRTVTRAMNDMGIGAADAGPFMDMLLVTSQQTGITIDTLADKMARFGSPLRQVGIDAQTSAALIGSFEKAGVNTDLVMGSLRISLGKLAKEGAKDLPAALAKGIESIKNAETGGKAAAKAIELFGSRAGPDMAAAIREGRLEVGDLVAMLGDSEGALAATTAAVDGPQESFARLKNQALLLGASLAEAAIPIVEKLIPAIQQVVTWFQTLDPGVRQTIITVAAVAAAVGPLILILGKLVMGIGAVSTAMGFLIANPVVLAIVAIVAAIAGLVVGLKYAYENFEGFRNFVDSVWQGIQVAVAGVVDWFQAYVWPILQEVFGYIQTALGVLWKAYTTYWGFIWSVVQKVVAWFMEYVWPTLSKVFDGIGVALGLLWNAYKAYWTLIANAVRVVVEWFMAYVWPTLSKVFGFIGTALGVLWDAYKRYWTFIWDLVKKVVAWFMDTMWPTIRTAFDNAKRGAELLWGGIRVAFDLIRSHVQTVVNTVLGILRGIGTIVATVVGFFDSMRQGIIDKFTAAVAWLRNLGQSILTAIGDVSRLLWNIGRSIIEGLWNGMKEMWSNVTGWVSGLGGVIQGLKGPIETDRKLLVPQGRAIMQGLGAGMRSGFRFVVEATGSITQLVQRAAERLAEARAALARATSEDAKKAAREALEDAQEAYRALVRAVRRTMLEAAEAVLDRWKQVADDVISYVGGIVQQIRDFGRLSGFDLNAIDQARKALVDAEQDVAEAIKARAKAQEALNRATQDGSDDEVAEARDALADASNKVIDAELRMRNAQREVQRTAPTAANILGDMRRRLGAAAGFAGIVRQLSMMGLNNASLQEIIGLGPGAGATFGQALIAGGPQAIAEINSLEAALTGIGEAIGDVGARSEYGMGLTSARGIAGTNITLQNGAVVVNFGPGVSFEDRTAIEDQIDEAIDRALGALAREISAS